MRRVAWSGVLLLALGACATSPEPAPAPRAAQQPAWVTPEEAELAPSRSRVRGGRKAEPDDGPRIVLVKPESTQAIPTPVDVVLRFEPRDAAAVALDTLRVEYLKFITIDITDRIRPYASADGIRGEGVPFPEGKHRIRISLADVLGRLTSLVFEIRVVDGGA